MDDPLTRFLLDAREGETGAATSFIRSSQEQVWRLCAHLVDPESADDLTQETYLRAFQALPAFRGDSSARTWLLAIARRTCHDELRRRTRRRRRDALLARDPGPARTHPDPAEQLESHALLDHLDLDRRTAFVLTQLFALSYAEAAAVCECPVGTIRSRVARARTELIAVLEDAEGGGQRQETQPVPSEGGAD